ncbi:MAG TPA: DUF4384 domain-containing protein [Bryobacteraceae bacterium]|nr:DUF4384 domain-containing protein [Bryobacteraceae bacterium]
MTQDEIRKLLGGYATNALSADERRILFQAALEDQELFNALQDEDSLRELLADPVTRDEVRRVLEASDSHMRRPSFWSRRWMFGVAIPALAAVILIVVMNRANAPRLIAPVSEVASAPPTQSREMAPPAPAPKLEARAPQAKKQSAPIQLESAREAVPAPAPRVMLASPRAVPDAIRQQFASGFVASAPPYEGPLVRYSLVRSGPNGDALRVNVTSEVAGYIALYEVDPAGSSKQVYPENQPANLVLAGSTTQIPSAPIMITQPGEKLRLVIVPAPSSAMATTGGIGGVINGAPKDALSAQAPQAPLVVDIPLGPN